MPASITHELVARETVDLLPKRTQELLFAAMDYYLLGAQGPDLFFFYRPLSGKTENFGRALHRTRVGQWFAALLRALPDQTGSDFEKCLAYALGFCTHLAADAVFHPFVYSYIEAYGAPASVHREIENDWDVYFLGQLRGRSAVEHEYTFDLRKIGEDGVLYGYLREVGRLWGRPLHAGAFRRMLRGFGLYLSHTHARNPHLLRLLGMEEFYPREQPNPAYLYGRRFWQLAHGQGRSADELFLRATTESAERINAFLEAFNAGMVLPDALFSLHMLTGTPL